MLAVELRAQRLALHIRHHMEQQPVGLTGIEQRPEVRMLQVRRDLDLAEGPLDAEHCAEFGAEDLQRDVAVVLDVAGEESSCSVMKTTQHFQAIRERSDRGRILD